MSSVFKIINGISHESQLFLVAFIAYLLFSKGFILFSLFIILLTHIILNVELILIIYVKTI